MQRKEGKKEGSKAKGGLNDPSQQHIYQAIVIASCDEDEFRSHDSSSPVCLQEVAGAPILDYVLKSLNSPRIKEIIVMSGKHKQQLQAHLAQYTPDKFPKRVEFMYTEGKNSIGAYLHEIESQKKVQECFVLVHGSLITNTNIEDVLDDFESKMELDNNIVMLRVFAKGSTLSEQRTTRTGEYVMLDNQQRIMKIANVAGNHVKLQENHRLEFENLSNYRISFDLYDTGLSVCKTNVLKNYHENFDYTSERQYLDGLLASEVLAETVFLHELPTDRYGVNVLNPQLLLRANLDALRGYMENLMNFDPNSIGKFKERFLQANEPNSFYSPSVQMDYDCHLGINSIIMENSKLGSQSRFSDCILGTNCSVGAKTQVHLSLLSQEVQVGSNCVLRNCYIGKGVRIHDDCRLVNCRIEQNAIIDQGAKFEGLIIKSGRERAPFTGTTAFRKNLLEDDDELDFNEPEKVSAVTIDPTAKLANFNEKVKEFIFKGDEEGDEVRKISKDVSNLKLDMNIDYSAWISTTTRSIFDLIRAKTQQVPAANKAQKWDEIIETWKPMWEAFQTEASRMEILKAISESWAEERVYTVLNAVVLAYKHDIVSKESVISWHDNRLEETLKPKFQAFYATLLKEDSDSDDDEDSDDSGDSDSKSSA